jgi:hypothetical protein
MFAPRPKLRLVADTVPQKGMLMMIEQLKRAFALAEQRSEQEQRVLADLLFAEMQADERWDVLFADARSEVLLERMVAEALTEDDAGETEEITGDAFV